VGRGERLGELTLGGSFCSDSVNDFALERGRLGTQSTGGGGCQRIAGSLRGPSAKLGPRDFFLSLKYL